MMFTGVEIPQNISWSRHLNLTGGTDVDDLLKASLIHPLGDFLGNSGKNIRPRLVELGLRLALEKECEKTVDALRPKLFIASSVIEAIHSGSLIIDDIQDESLSRRSAPTLHIKHGVPLALNAGNWLYFWALEQIEQLELSAKTTQALLFRILKLMTRAHFGQALDLGTRIDHIEQSRVPDISLAAMELKTGTLFTLAYVLGASLHSADGKKDYSGLFSRLGIALQAMDDVGNFLCPQALGDPKRHEDLRLKRPGWVWREAAGLSPQSYEQFLAALALLPDESALEQWCQRLGFKERLKASAEKLLSDCRRELEAPLKHTHPRALEMIHEIIQILEKAYA